MQILRLTACFLLLLALHAQSAAGQTVPAATEPVPAERPRIGLVLGGGGARGAAHIGVIRELERMRVPIDAIAGTSMGALVGGLYAAGRNAEELEQVLQEIDWAGTMSDTPRREDLNFRRKEDDQQFPIRYELGLEDGELQIPMGLVQGHRLELLLHELTVDVAHIRDFDDLPVPFRAVASDLERAEAHIIADGNLAHAMRASMSVPGLFAPARADGRLLADGGLFANLPIDVMRAMDVDVIIAVNVEFPLYPAEELDSALKISEQMLTILLRKETQRQIRTLGDLDILIEPDLGTFASTNFGEVAEAVQPGADAALAAEDRLRQLALSETAYAAYSAQRRGEVQAPRRLAFVRIEHDGSLSDAVLRARLQVQPGDAVEPRRLAADADRLYGLNLYEQVNYHLVEEAGEVGVVYEAITKSWGKNDLLFGVSLEDDLDGATAFNVTTRLTRVGINDRGGEWRTDLQLGTDPAIFSEFYQPLVAGRRWFVAPRVLAGNSNRGAYVDDTQVARLRESRVAAGFDFGRLLGYAGELRAGVFRGTSSLDVNVGAFEIPDARFASGGMRSTLRLDTLDDAHFPRHGFRGQLSWTGFRSNLGADANFDQVGLELESNWTRGRSTFQAAVSYSTSNEPDIPLQEQNQLGGFQRLSGLSRDALGGPHAALLRVAYRRRLGASSGGLFDMPTYVGASLETGNVWAERADIDFDSALVHGSVFGGLDTLIGPVFLGAGFGEDGARNYYLFVGAPPR